jgi:hypothetical protein
VLSILVWKERNPEKVKLYTNQAGYKSLEDDGIIHLYDSIDIDTIENRPQLNEKVFWAAGKIFAYENALKTQKNPIFLDTDALLWANIRSVTKDIDVIVAHTEKFNTLLKWHPFFKGFKKQLNVSFLWFKNNALGLEYVYEAINYILNMNPSDDEIVPNWAYMCFAEQVILFEVIKRTKRPSNRYYGVIGYQKSNAFKTKFTHLWGDKAIYRNDKDKDEEYSKQIMDSFGKEIFPNEIR